MKNQSQHADAQLANQATKTVLIGDSHQLVAQGLAGLLGKSFQTVRLARSGEELLASVRCSPPDVVIAEVFLPGITGIDAMKIAQQEGLRVPFVFLTMHDDAALAVAAIRAGARGYLLKSSAGDELLEALSCVDSGGTYVAPNLVLAVITASAPPRPLLTEKQLRILEGVALGLRSKEIAYELGISVRTVESHKYLMMQELGVHTSIELVQKARQEGLLETQNPMWVRRQ